MWYTFVPFIAFGASEMGEIKQGTICHLSNKITILVEFMHGITYNLSEDEIKKPENALSKNL